jgi:predicted TIM-barrel fold metal-dependent hydrolase
MTRAPSISSSHPAATASSSYLPLTSRKGDATSSPTKNRCRKIRAGLDNAVRQAEERGLHDVFIVDADCHMMEPFSLFADRLPEQFRKIFTAPDYEADPFLSGRGGVDEKKFRAHEPEMNIRFKQRRKRTEVTYPKPQDPSELVALYTDRMYDLGIKRSVVFPTAMLDIGLDPRPEFEVALTNAYTDFVLENFLGKYPEILSPVFAPVNSPDRAAELIDRVGSEKGIVGVMSTSTAHALAGSDSWDPIYEAAQRKDLPFCMHCNNFNSGILSGFDSFLGVHTLARPLSAAVQVTSMLVSGVPERFPKLKFVIIEGGLSWIPWLMQRLDSVYLMRREEAPILQKLPSEYIRERFYFTSQPLEFTGEADLKYTFDKIGAEDHLMFASDYPHWDFDLPSVIYDIPFLTEGERRKILGENATKLFKITPVES